MPTSTEIRKQFIDHFIKKHGHTFAPSSPVVPHDDPTLLFTNAGMNQFKPIFLGQVDPSSDLAKLKRAVNSQKCIRAGGKHNDLDDVGRDFYHHTFFEMLGNWSFGDYFKKEAIDWAWELLTEVWKIPAEQLYATYFGGDESQGLEPDDEAKELWLRHLPPERVLPGNMKDNFWEMGDTGPCGPCSEVHIDSRPDAERAATPGRDLVNMDHEDVIELWNLVFIQFNRSYSSAGNKLLIEADRVAQGGKFEESQRLREQALENREFLRLPAKHVDTGLGLERITRVIQGKRSNYDTDIFTPLFAKIQEITGAAPYAGDLKDPKDVAYRVIADHIRALVFAMTDGADPSNEGRGYVLRRILRRAVRHGRQTLGATGPFLCELAPTLIEQMGEFFPELKKNPQRVIDVIREEEEAFGRTLERGTELLEQAIGNAFYRQFSREQLPQGGARYLIDVRVEDTDRGISNRYGLPHPYLDEDRDLWLPNFTKFTIYKTVDSQGEPVAIDSPYLCELESRFVDKWCSSTPHVPASVAFKLHDTYGFPIDLTQIMAEERGLTVDVEGFERLMEEARERSRAGAGGGAGDTIGNLTTDAVASLQKMNIRPTDDNAKYDPELRPIQATVRAVWNGSDFDENVEAAHTRPTDRFAIVLDKTNYYAESGGQVGDSGRLIVTREVKSNPRDKHEGGEFIVEDTRATAGYVLHIGRIKKGELRVGDTVECRIDKKQRAAVMANHTGTHLLNFALKDTLGDHIDQKGSLVAPDRLRFDFSHSSSMKPEEAERIERTVREQIAQKLEVHAAEAPLATAKSIFGVRAVFGETYPDPVRVVSIGAPVASLVADPSRADWSEQSVEFCGGTHVATTGDIQSFALIEEEAVAKGVRRVVAFTGKMAEAAAQAGADLRLRIEHASKLEGAELDAESQAILGELESLTIPYTDKAAIRTALAGLQDRIKSARKAAAAAGRDEAVDAARSLAAESSGPVIIGESPAGGDRGALLAAMDVVKAKHPDAAIMLFSVDAEEGKISIAASVAPDLVKSGFKAGDWVRAAAEACGGKGGGRPDSAQGGGTEPAKLPDAISAAEAFAAARVS